MDISLYTLLSFPAYAGLCMLTPIYLRMYLSLYMLVDYPQLPAAKLLGEDLGSHGSI
jgi:hypothetical protein